MLGRIAETLGQAATIVLVLWIILGRPLGSLQFFYLSFLPILWIAMRQGVSQVVNGILMFRCGIVVALHLIPTSPELLMRLALPMLVLSATGLIVGSAVSEGRAVGRELSARSTFLNALIENNPLGIVVLGPRRTSPTVQRCLAELTSLVVSGHTTQKCVRRMRKDGSVIDVELNAVPLLVGRRVQGSFAIYKDVSEQVRTTEEVKRKAESLNAAVGKLQLRTSQMTLLNEMSALLQSRAVFILKPSEATVELAAKWAEACVSEHVFPMSSCWGLRRQQPNWSEYPGDSVICSHLKNAVAASYLCVPVMVRDTMGRLHIQLFSNEGATARLYSLGVGDISLGSRHRILRKEEVLDVRGYCSTQFEKRRKIGGDLDGPDGDASDYATQ